MQSNTTAIALTTFNGEPRVDSRVIADHIGANRKVTYQMVRRNCADFERFGTLRLEVGAIQGRRDPERYALLNEEQCYRLLTYFDYTQAVSQLRRGLVLAFGDGRRGAAPPACQEQRPPDFESTALVPFSFESRALRFIPNGDSFSVVAKDVAEALDYSWKGIATISHVPVDWRGVYSVQTPSGIQEMLTFSEQGFYFFVNRSDKPKALPLQKWVAGEVLPAIRKTGSYSLPGTPPAIERPLTAALRLSINRHAWRLAQESFETYRVAMLDAARVNPTFKPEQWNPVECLPMPQPDPPDMADMARQLAIDSPYRSRNPQRDYEVLRLRLEGMTYREVGTEVGISQIHAWRIVQRQLGKAGAV